MSSHPPIRGPYGYLKSQKLLGYGIYEVKGTKTSGIWVAPEIRPLAPHTRYRKTAWFGEVAMRGVAIILYKSRMTEGSSPIEYEQAVHTVCMRLPSVAEELGVGTPTKTVFNEENSRVIESLHTNKQYRKDTRQFPDPRNPAIPVGTDEKAFLNTCGYEPVDPAKMVRRKQ